VLSLFILGNSGWTN